MMRSMFSGVSGLRTHQTRMDVIGHNIANVNTVGFKAQRMTFADAISQRIAGATGDNPDVGRAGRNPTQIGLGVNIGGIDSIMRQGAAQRTDRPTDLTIQGEGFFIVNDNSGTFFTRAGNIDWNGHVFSIGGMQLMGWNAVEDRNRPGSFVIEQGAVQPLVTPPETRFMDPSATTMVDIIGNININDKIDGEIIRPVQFYDSLGNMWTADMRLSWHPPLGHPEAEGPDGVHSTNAISWWSFDFLPATDVDGTPGMSNVTIFPDGDRNRGVTVQMNMGFTQDNVMTGEVGAPGTRGRIGFSPLNGRITHFHVETPTPAAGAAQLYRREMGLFFHVPALPPPSVVGDVGVIGENLGVDVIAGFNSGVIRLNMDALRQHMGEHTSVQSFRADGNTSGSLVDISIGGDGIIMARYTNGEMRPLGQIPLAHFLNPEGLERMGNNLWATTANSGLFDGVGRIGDLAAGTLEMSNVELSNEFTEMITTQRGFQANSRVITTSDEMLQELVNLKR